MSRPHWLTLQERLAARRTELEGLEQLAQHHQAIIAQQQQGLAVTGQQMLRVQGALAELEALLAEVEDEEQAG